MGGFSQSVLLGIVVAIGVIAFLGIRPHQVWILWLTAGLTALATDGIVRVHPAWRDHRPAASAVHALLPALGVLALGFFVDHALSGYARPLAAIIPAFAIGGLAYLEYLTVDFSVRRFGTFRLILAVATYLTAFALFTVAFANHVGVAAGAVFTGLVSFALTLELLRENRHFGEGAVLLGVAVGISLAELRLALYFFPLDELLAGALLIIGFYLATGFVHHLLDHDLEWETAMEYVLVAGVGTAAVVVTRIAV